MTSYLIVLVFFFAFGTLFVTVAVPSLLLSCISLHAILNILLIAKKHQANVATVVVVSKRMHKSL